MNVDQPIITCQQEHQAYRQSNTLSSPVSIQLFRLAFSGDVRAWAYLYKIFKSQIKEWIGIQCVIDPEDVMQETWLSFARYAPRSQTLTATESLGPVLAYLRRCVKTTLVDQARALKKGPQAVIPITEISEPIAFDNPADQAALSVILQERLELLITDEQEKLVFHLRFACNILPREILVQYSDRFKSRQEIITIICRLNRRLRQDPVLIELYYEC